MKTVMSGLDLRAIANELSQMAGSHCKKCYQPHYEQVVLRLRAKSGGNTDLVLVRGKRIYTSQRDRPMPQYPAPFAMVLRKVLTNARLKAVEQVGFDKYYVSYSKTLTAHSIFMSKYLGTEISF